MTKSDKNNRQFMLSEEQMLTYLRGIFEQAHNRADAIVDGAVERFASERLAATTPPTAARKTSVERTAKQYPDSLFINALSGRFQTARELHNRLKASGVSRGSIYARYQRLASDPKSGVVEDSNSFRLRPERKMTANAKPVRRRRIARAVQLSEAAKPVVEVMVPASLTITIDGQTYRYEWSVAKRNG